MKAKILNHILYLYIIIHQFVFSQVNLPCVLGDGMVLQRDTKVKIWGWAAPGEKVTIKLMDNIYNMSADPQGNWNVILPPMKAGGPYTLEVDASNHIKLKNILNRRCMDMFRAIEDGVDHGKSQPALRRSNCPMRK
jgi:hypothetical protein